MKAPLSMAIEAARSRVIVLQGSLELLRRDSEVLAACRQRCLEDTHRIMALIEEVEATDEAERLRLTAEFSALVVRLEADAATLMEETAEFRRSLEASSSDKDAGHALTISVPPLVMAKSAELMRARIEAGPASKALLKRTP